MYKFEWDKISGIDELLGKALKLLEEGEVERAKEKIKEAKTWLMEGVY